jgi:hypothetical protein
MAATMKKVISTINITGFAISLNGFRRTSELISTLLETSVGRRANIILLILVAMIFSH